MPALMSDLISYNAGALIHVGNNTINLTNDTPATRLPPTTGLILSSRTYTDTSANPSVTSTGLLLTMSEGTELNKGAGQLLLEFNSDASNPNKKSDLYIRSKATVGNGDWSDWNRIIDSGNIFEYTAQFDGTHATGTWGISITGGSHVAKYLWPIGTSSISATNPPDYSDTMLRESGHQKIWGQSFALPLVRPVPDTNPESASIPQTYTDANGLTQNYTDKGQISFQLNPAEHNDNVSLDIFIDGTFYGKFNGHLIGYADSATKANITTERDSLAYYSTTDGLFSYTGNMYRMHTQINSENAAEGYLDGLKIIGQPTSTTVTKSSFTYDSSGPQILFQLRENSSISTEASITMSKNIVNSTVSGTDAVFYFRAHNTSAIVDSNHLIAQNKAAIGQSAVDANNTFKVNGTSFLNGTVSLTPVSDINNADIYNYIVWNPNGTNSHGLYNGSIGIYDPVENHNTPTLLSISNLAGIDITTTDIKTLTHNGLVIPVLYDQQQYGNVGAGNQPVFVSNGSIQPINYSINANLPADEAANRLLTYLVENSVKSLKATSHYIDNDHISIASTSASTYALFVNGTTGLLNDISIGNSTINAAHNRSIYFITERPTASMIRFLYNNESGEGYLGPGLELGGGGLVKIAVGPTSNALTIPANTASIQLLSDGNITLEAGYHTITTETEITDEETGETTTVTETTSSRMGLQVTVDGNVVPTKNGAAVAINEVTRPTLGDSSGVRWGALFVGTANSYGSTSRPIYWSNGVPAPINYSIGANIEYEQNNNANRIAYYSAADTISPGAIITDGHVLSSVDGLAIGMALPENASHLLYIAGGSTQTGNHVFNEIDEIAHLYGGLKWQDTTNSAYIQYELVDEHTSQLVIKTHYELVTPVVEPSEENGEESGEEEEEQPAPQPYVNRSLVVFKSGADAKIYIAPDTTTIYPAATNTGTLGLGSNKWNTIFLNTSIVLGNTTILPQSSSAHNFYLPDYADTMYAVHTGSTAAVGGLNQPVYVAANGRVTAMDNTYGAANQPVYLNAGVFTPVSYTLDAQIDTGTANKIAYYAAAHQISPGTIVTDGTDLSSIGKLTVGTTLNSDYQLYVDGTAAFTGNVTMARYNNKTFVFDFKHNTDSEGNVTGQWVDMGWNWSTGEGGGATFKTGLNPGELGRFELWARGRINGTLYQHYLQGYGDANSATLRWYGCAGQTGKYSIFFISSGNPKIYTTGDNVGSLGTSSNRWGKAYLGTANSYGDEYTPIYWNDGVPCAITTIQKINWSMDNTHKSCRIAHATMFTANSIVLQIVVTSGESNLNAPLTWASGAGFVAINTSTAVSGTVSGYILVARGSEYADSNFTYSKTTAVQTS